MRRFKKDDMVIVITGSCKNQRGKILRVLPGDSKVIVSGVNLKKKHVKPQPQLQREGGIKEIEASIHVSNIALINPVTNKADKVGFKFLEKDGKTVKVRYFKSNDELVDVI